MGKEDDFNNIVEKKINAQIKHCQRSYLTQKQYYQGALAALVTIIGITVGLALTAVKASYEPVRDIAILKMELKIINNKLDNALKAAKE